MHIKILAVFIGVVCLFAAITGCSDNAATTTPTPAQPQQSTAFNSYEELTANAVCNESVNGSVAYTALENANFICTVDAATGAWTWVLVQEDNPQTEQPVQSGENNTQNCPNGILADGTCNNGLPSNWNEYANGTAKGVEEGPGYVTDLRWGRNKTYRTVTIGSQVWMAEDIDVSGNCGNSGYWSYLGGYCEPEDGVCEGAWGSISDINTGFYSCSSNTINCKQAFSQSIQGACPVGWHIPKESEWLVLAQSLSDSSLNDGYLYYFNKNKLAQAGFPMNFCGDGGSRSTYFWTSSLASKFSEDDYFLYNSDGSVFNMRMRIVSFSEALGLTMTRTTIENVVSSSADVSSQFHGEYKARLRCVKN